MTELLVVDGYNFIFNLIKEKDIGNDALAFYRDRLINDLISYYHHKKREIILVFDARHTQNQAAVIHSYSHIKVIYSGSGETADSVIEKLVETSPHYNKVYVVTSDYTQQKVVFKGNIFRISSREFGIELDESKRQLGQQIKKINSQSKSTFYNLERRLSKKTIDDFKKIRKS